MPKTLADYAALAEGPDVGMPGVPRWVFAPAIRHLIRALEAACHKLASDDWDQDATPEEVAQTVAEYLSATAEPEEAPDDTAW